MPIVPLHLQKSQGPGVRDPDMGCHAPGKRRRSGKPLYRTPKRDVTLSNV